MTSETQAVWAARHFDGVTPQPRQATARLEPGSLAVTAADGDTRRWPLASVVVMNADRSGVQLELHGERIESLIVADWAFAATLRAANGGRMPRRLGGSAPALRLLLVLAATATLVLFSAWRWGIPALAGVAADRVPPRWERQFGTLIVDDIAPERDRITDPIVTAPVRQIFDLLVHEQASARDSFQIVILRSKMVNAFAVPGGTVVVTTGLFDALRGPEELAAVLAHEISHVALRHTTRGLFARLGVRALFSLLAGDGSGIGQVAGAAGMLGELSYSRSDEIAADRGAAGLLARSGIDPKYLDRALESISGAAGGGEGMSPTFLSTHPATGDRRQRARELAKDLRVDGVAALPDKAAWESMRAMAK